MTASAHVRIAAWRPGAGFLSWVLACLLPGLAGCNDDSGSSSAFGVSATSSASAATMASGGGSTSNPGTSSGGETTAEPTSTSGASDTGSSTTAPATTGGTTTSTTTSGGGAACGDGTKDDAEECDTVDFGGADCVSLGFEGGTLNCINCKINTLGCFACGDGMVHQSEACDGDNFGVQTCESLGFGPGTLSCSADCLTIDTAGCMPMPKCGDGVINTPMEKCDGMDLGGQDCVSQGFDMGTLACGVTCQFNTAGCSDICKLAGQPCMGISDCCNTGCGKGGSSCIMNGVNVCCT
jgi:hypothetical protein